ncbi:hypothetical protein M3649_17820 [Ureibacillus chungkukjangi]|uniref:hypothetical protein n=1 Tax=Ureibacillus chungkukjangi TaxID=1202712 RepID=UPI00203D0BCF|nr:hypothetical protein [Ureibacillus chungkukjangi]MCM3389980.1 hypothetical protein [Ureibacillus chungkukjangi]
MELQGLKLLSTMFLPSNDQDVDVNEKGEILTNSGTSREEVSNSLIELGSTGALKAMDWGVNAITIVFIVGVIMMIMAIIFKVGQWQKFAQTTMLWSFISMLLLRAIPITILSFRSDADVDQAFSAALAALCQVAIFVGVTGILLSFLFRFGYKLIEHPEYHRWSKNILNVSVIMIFFALVGPFLFGIM